MPPAIKSSSNRASFAEVDTPLRNRYTHCSRRESALVKAPTSVHPASAPPAIGFDFLVGGLELRVIDHDAAGFQRLKAPFGSTIQYFAGG